MVSFGKKTGWEKIGDLSQGIVGSLWYKNGLYYYFDNLGKSQLVNDTVYKITDKSVANELLASSKDKEPNSISVERIRKIIADKKMEPISGDTVFDASVTIFGSKYRIVKIGGIFIALVLIILARRNYWKTREY